MANPPSPPLSRLRRPTWNDPRLLVGIALILGATALGWWVFERASHTITLYEATTDIVAGQSIEPSSLREVEIAGTVRTNGYASPATLPAGQLLAVSGVGAGELIPLRALSTAQASELRPVTIALGSLAPAQLAVGDLVDLWLLPERDETEQPRLLGESLAVSHIDTPGGSLGAVTSLRVELMVPQAKLPTLLAAMAGAGELTVMRVPHS